MENTGVYPKSTAGIGVACSVIKVNGREIDTPNTGKLVVEQREEMSILLEDNAGWTFDPVEGAVYSENGNKYTIPPEQLEYMVRHVKGQKKNQNKKTSVKEI